MPAIITHHLFGEEASRRLPDQSTFAEEELLAFLLGNQGADPFAFCFTATLASIRVCHAFANAMKHERIVDALLAARESVSHLPAEDQGIGHAFALGLMAHYLLDSEAHAFILAQEHEICSAGVGLDDAHEQVHGLIESELDTWMLWSTRQQTIADAPAHADLMRTERVSRVGGAIFSQVAWQVYALKLGPNRYEQCLRDYEFVYRCIDPAGSPRGRMIAGAERLGTRRARLATLAHAATAGDDCAAANLDCHPWRDPLTGKMNTTSFPDVFYDSLETWPTLAEAFIQGDRDALEQLVQRGYDGSPLT